MNKKYLLAIDQGTSSSRTVIYTHGAKVVASAQQEFPQIYPEPGWVEHDPEAIWDSVTAVTSDAMQKANAVAAEISAIGITNQRETTVIWDRESGECVYNAIVWQDRRTAAHCQALKREGLEPMVAGKTGLRLDPYFSATKIAWILDNVAGVRERAEAGKLAFGTIDTFLLWRLTGGVHATDATNASRTLLFNIHNQEWDDELLRLFSIPRSLLPDVLDCAADFGVANIDSLGGDVPVCGIAGDQQAALIGQAGFDPGMTKSTYGTGCFVIANTGEKALQSARADSTAARQRNIRFAESRHQRTQYKNRCPHRLDQFVRRLTPRHATCVDFDAELVINRDLHAHHLQQRQHRRDVFEMRHVADPDRFGGEQCSRQDRQRSVLRARNDDVAGQCRATLY